MNGQYFGLGFSCILNIGCVVVGSLFSQQFTSCPDCRPTIHVNNGTVEVFHPAEAGSTLTTFGAGFVLACIGWLVLFCCWASPSCRLLCCCRRGFAHSEARVSVAAGIGTSVSPRTILEVSAPRLTNVVAPAAARSVQALRDSVPPRVTLPLTDASSDSGSSGWYDPSPDPSVWKPRRRVQN